MKTYLVFTVEVPAGQPEMTLWPARMAGHNALRTQLGIEPEAVGSAICHIESWQALMTCLPYVDSSMPEQSGLEIILEEGGRVR